MAESSKTVPLALLVFAALVGYAGWSGDGLSVLNVQGVQARKAHVDSLKIEIADYEAKIDTAKKDLAKESLEDLTKRVDSYRASLGVLRTLVPEQREVANLLDDITTRARVNGVTVMTFSPQVPVAGPTPFDTYSYNLTVLGRYNNVGRFLTSIASMRRIMVPGDVSLTVASAQSARALGDTTAMLEAKFTMRTYVKGKPTAEDSTHAQ
jgi:Tfp pilus assembly protein PilO